LKAKKLFSEAIKFSQTDKLVKDALSEGDTKTEHAQTLPETSKRQTLFHPYFGDLAELDEKSVAQQMQARYQKLDAFLEQIRKNG
jgi:hypothetical protein